METLFKQLLNWLLGGAGAGACVMIYRHFFLDRKQRQDAQEKLIDTLQKMTFDNLEKITKLQTDVDYWRREHNELGKKHEQALHENEELKKQMHSLSRQYTDLKRKYDELTKKAK